MRWPFLIAGVVSIAVAFFAATHVADTREGLVYEVVTLFAALIGVILILVGLFAPAMRSRGSSAPRIVSGSSEPQVHFASELLTGAGGLVLAALLLTGLAASAGPMWGLLGLALLLPMIAGSAYLCFRFIRGPKREWKIDLGHLTGRHSSPR
jgi:hypothetical protein